MSRMTFEKIFDRFLVYRKIIDLAGADSIANLAKIEADSCLIFTIDHDGSDFLKRKVEGEIDSKLKISILLLIAAFDKEYALTRYRLGIDSKDPDFLFGEPYGWKNMNDDKFHLNTLNYYTGLRKNKAYKKCLKIWSTY